MQLLPRETRCFHNITLTQKHFGPVHIALGRPSDGPEQWQVVSDEPTSVETFAEYGERFQIEEGFLDEKSGLFGLEDSEVRDAPSLERLLTVLAVATLLLVSEGIEVGQRGDRACRRSPLAARTEGPQNRSAGSASRAESWSGDVRATDTPGWARP
ncbi:hypothetical protein [Deinococcus marmoris]|uniref:hypothetical protein n=1 Tax=Deinococcus marmoris TaxID=249408 RepID=UPI00111506DE|nr:hypothetical protein [Deinococcus marmoris]